MCLQSRCHPARMPTRKEPASLQSIAMDILLKQIVNYCDDLSARESSENLCQGISVIKEEVHPRIVWHLLPKLCERFLNEFSSKERPEWQYQAALEVIMDVDIIGLRCGGSILEYLDPQDGHRFRRLVELDLTHFSTGVYAARTIDLQDLHLEHLTTFIFPYNCTDLHLEALGLKCPRLQVVKIRHSSDATDEGMRSLGLCHELRVVDIDGCPEIGHFGLNCLLFVNKKMEDLSCGPANFDPHFFYEDHYSSRFDTSEPCPSIKRFSMNSAYYVTDDHARSLVAKFPNLNHLSVSDAFVEDLSVLGGFSELRSIDLNLNSEGSASGTEQVLLSLRKLLTCIGANVRTLKFSFMDKGVFLNQDGLNFVFESCPNIENLAFDHGYEDLVIPSFEKLRDLSISVRRVSDFDVVTRVQALRFPKMSKLEDLVLYNFGIGLECVKSMIVDDKRFPKLALLRTDSMTVEGVREIEEIAKNNNLKFTIINRGYPPYLRTRIELV